MPNGVIPHGGFILWKIRPEDARDHPSGAIYAGFVRAPNGSVLGIHAYVVNVNGRDMLQGGVYESEAPPVEQPPDVLYDKPIGVPPRPVKPARPPRACAESQPRQSRAVPAGKSAPPQPDLLAAPAFEFDDTTTFEELPL